MEENKQIIMGFLRDRGLNDMAIAGVMGNIQQESEFSTTAKNGSSGAFGLFQWTDGRLNNLKKFAFDTGSSINDINTQLAFFWNELETTESKTKDVLLKSNYSSASEYAEAFEASFERSGGSELNKRKTYAESIYTSMGGSYDANHSIFNPSSSVVNSMGLKWWGDIVVVVFAILLIIGGVVMVGMALTSNKTVQIKQLKGGGKDE